MKGNTEETNTQKFYSLWISSRSSAKKKLRWCVPSKHSVLFSPLNGAAPGSGTGKHSTEDSLFVLSVLHRDYTYTIHNFAY